MSREIHVEVDDTTYDQLTQLAADGDAEPGRFAAQLLTASVGRARFTAGAAAFAAEHGAAFAARFGAGQGQAAA
jgi:hypothetical protein